MKGALVCCLTACAFVSDNDADGRITPSLQNSRPPVNRTRGPTRGNIFHDLPDEQLSPRTRKRERDELDLASEPKDRPRKKESHSTRLMALRKITMSADQSVITSDELNSAWEFEYQPKKKERPGTRPKLPRKSTKSAEYSMATSPMRKLQHSLEILR
jgi:hypothetical protein